MKRKITHAAAAALITASMLTLGSCSLLDDFFSLKIWSIFEQNDVKDEDDMKAQDFESIIIDINGTEAATQEYEVLRTADGVRISYYYGPWNYSDDEPKEDYLEMRTEGGSELFERVLGLVNDCKVKKWDGYSKSASGVLDGESFSFTAVIDGKELSGYGSNSFPSGFRDFENALWDIMKENN